jgi:hypothetical protein
MEEESADILSLGKALGRLFVKKSEIMSPFPFLSCATAGFMLPKIAIPLVLCSLFIFLSLSLYAEILHKNEYKFALKSLMGSSDKLLNQINVNYNNAMLANELGQSINKKLSVEGRGKRGHSGGSKTP